MAPMMMTPMMIGTTQLIIILVIVVVLFGGTKLAGLGKSTGKAIREFKDETTGLRGDHASDQQSDVVDAEVVDTDDQPQAAPPQMNAATGGANPGSAAQSRSQPTGQTVNGSDQTQDR